MTKGDKMLYQSLSEETRQDIQFAKAAPYHPWDGEDSWDGSYPGFAPGITKIPKGWVREEGFLPAARDILWERDVAVKLRDGTTVYVDIWRPVTEDPVPCLLNSSIFGKHSSQNAIFHWYRWVGVQKAWVSGMQSFEALDPIYWANQGYAVCNMDIRGVFKSEGDSCYFGSQDAQDNYDMIEYLGTRDWCNGAVAMGGSSWLGINQWFAAAAHPPHLKAIAVLEGHGNMYNDEYMRGGIPNYSAARETISFGENRTENLRAMMRKYPLRNEYWEDKTAKFEEVTIPAYVIGSYDSPLHTQGSIEGFRKIASKDKWLRIHNTQEWPDSYQPDNVEELKQFFDYFLKGIENQWAKTPRVRIAVLDPGGEDEIKRPVAWFPLPEEKLVPYYLDASDATLSPVPVPEESFARYPSDPKKRALSPENIFQCPIPDMKRAELDPEAPGVASFRIAFAEETEVIGYIKAKLWMEAVGTNDMDVYVRISKLDKDGNTLFHDCMFLYYPGPDGMLRASLRAVDPERSTPCEPYHPYNTLSYLEPGQVVPMEIGLWPTALKFHPGEQLCVTIAGYNYLGMEAQHGDSYDRNPGEQVIHTGGRYDSHILIPVVDSRGHAR